MGSGASGLLGASVGFTNPIKGEFIDPKKRAGLDAKIIGNGFAEKIKAGGDVYSDTAGIFVGSGASGLLGASVGITNPDHPEDKMGAFVYSATKQ